MTPFSGPHRPARHFDLARRSLMALAIGLLGSLAAPAADAAETLRIGYQKSSTLIALLKANGELEKALAPLDIKISWHEFSSGLPLLEAINIGSIDVGADVADTVPVFAQAAGAKLAYVAEEAASPSAQAILVATASPTKSLADLKGKKIAVTKGAGSHYLLLSALAKAGLTFKDITPAYLPPADGRTAFVSNNVDAWVAWDPFLTSTIRQSGARVLTDGRDGLANYKRYYLASADYAAKHGDALNVIYGKLVDTGKWVKTNPAAAASQLAALWGIDDATVEEANSHRSYQVGAVTAAGLSEQQKIADAFLAEHVLPVKVDTSALAIWTPKAP
ncbi:aliphatic sulfonate ABC transporter substrate-binding protein [Bradyrhizobium sp. HKCCYLS2038]|uniref:aliphatic sulfonate ABC transporter substrate-binding protein n=1 Tax=unclassified Bradyrhizobium TaxID=2631580 RepID=UPI003EBC1278